MAYDLVIRGGRVVDGSGLPSYVADVGVKDGKVVDVGKLKDGAAKTIDAGGLAVSARFHRSSYPSRCADALGSLRHLRAAAWRDLGGDGELRLVSGAGPAGHRRRHRQKLRPRRGDSHALRWSRA